MSPRRLAIALLVAGAALLAPSAASAAPRQLDATCPGVFRVLQNDWIGTFAIPKGDYTLSLLSIGPMTCGQATGRFSAFLQDWDGRLPSPWLLDPVTGTFMEGSIYVGFRIAPAVTPLPGPVTPTRGNRCPGTFRVQHDDRIGALKLPKGRYTITRTGSGAPSCAASSNAFARFLARPSGRLPKPWKLDRATATFTNGSAGFRVKAVR